MEEEKRKTETLKFRASLAEILEVDEKAYQLGLSRSNYLRKLVFEKQVILYNFDGLNELTSQVGKIGVNINQIAKKLNEGGELNRENAEYLKGSMELLHSLIRKIYTDALLEKGRMESNGDNENLAD